MFHYLAIGFLAITLGAQIACCGRPEPSYVIKPRRVSDPLEAVSILRGFMPAKLTADQRCARFAVILNGLRKKMGAGIDNFVIADAAMVSDKIIEDKLRIISLGVVRDSYMKAIVAAKEKGQIDGNLLELHDCLRDKFYDRDNVARSFLNEPVLKNLVEQYKSIEEQPLSLLTDPERTHPTLKGNELVDEVKKSVLSIFGGHEAQLEAKFPAAEEPEVETAAEAEVIPEQVEEPVKPVQVVEIPAAQSAAFAYAGHPNELANNGNVGLPAAQAGAVAFAGQPMQEVQDNQVDLTPEEEEYFQMVIGGLHRLYEALPLESGLADRCTVYDKLMASEPADMTRDTFISGLVEELNNKLASEGRDEGVFNPEREIRLRFLYHIAQFKAAEAGDGAWTDLVDCVEQWKDPEVVEFMSTPLVQSIIAHAAQLLGDASSNGVANI